MYTGKLYRAPFQPDPAHLQHAREREEYAKRFLEQTSPPVEEREEKGEGIARLLEMVSPEDSALISLILFLLCDNSENDPVLLGILLYVLLSK